MNKGFEAGKIYELSQEWKDYFDTLELSGECFKGYYYAIPSEEEFKNNQIVNCRIVNKSKQSHPFFLEDGFAVVIPIKFSDVKLSSLSSSAKLKLFKIWITEDVPVEKPYEAYTDAVVVATDEEQAKTIHPNGTDRIPDGYSLWKWANDPTQVQVEYLGDYYGDESAGTVICARKVE